MMGSLRQHLVQVCLLAGMGMISSAIRIDGIPRFADGIEKATFALGVIKKPDNSWEKNINMHVEFEEKLQTGELI